MSADIEQADRSIRAGHASLGRWARDTGRTLASVAPRTMAAAIWGGAYAQGSDDSDAVALAARGWDGVLFGGGRAWRALLILAEGYGEPTDELRAASERRGGRYLNQPAWVLRFLLAAAEGELRRVAA